jgi:hypothetical protein
VSEQDLSGDWKIRYIKHKFGVTKSGSEQIGVLVQIAEGPGTGRQVPWYGSWSEAALPMTVEALQALGWEGKSLGTLSEDLKPGAEAMGNFGYEDDLEGVSRLRLKFINKMRDIRFAAELDGPKRVEFAKRIHTLIDRGAHLRKDKSGAASARPDDDDIPF